MTNHQDKELSGELPAFEDARVQIVYGVITGMETPPHGEHWDGFIARKIVAALATSIQLPVAEQPAGQAVSNDFAVFAAQASEAHMSRLVDHLQRIAHDSIKAMSVLHSVMRPDFSTEEADARIAGGDVAAFVNEHARLMRELKQGPTGDGAIAGTSNAAPHSPVAQMSGDATIRPTYYVRHPDGSFSVADPQPILRRYCAAQPQPVHMQVDMRPMLINIAHHWGRTITPDDESMFAEFITLATSHPSNAVQDAPIGYTSDYAIAHLDQAREGNHPAQTQVPLQAGSSFQYSVPVYRAATVPQVVQAPIAYIDPKVFDTATRKIASKTAITFSDRSQYGWTMPIYAAPQRVAASPSIVPSDDWKEEMIKLVEEYGLAVHVEGGTNRPRHMKRITDHIAVLTTASNAGEAVKGGEA